MHGTFKFGCAAASALLLGLALSARADDWPSYRGPNHDGTSRETGWTDHWGASGPVIAWKANAGLGFSDFVVSGNHAFTMGHADEQDSVICYDADTGKVAWKHSYPADLGDKYFEGGTTGSPTLDGNRLYTLNRWGDLFCFEAANGKVLWHKQIQKETGMKIPDWGYAGAPLVHNNLLVLNIGDAGLAVNKNTGEIAWKSANKNAGYSTPLPCPGQPQPLVVIGSSQSYVAVNPENGTEAWRVRWNTQYGVNAADPIIAGDKMFISTGYGKGAALFDLKQNPPAEIWKSKVLHTQLSPAVRQGDFIYGMDGDTGQNGPLKCIEMSTGKERWAEPRFGTGGLIIADGKIIALSSNGQLVIAPASPDGLKPTATGQVLGGKCWTAPVLANGRIYCRNSRGEIACVDVRGKSAGKP